MGATKQCMLEEMDRYAQQLEAEERERDRYLDSLEPDDEPDLEEEMINRQIEAWEDPLRWRDWEAGIF